MSTRTLAADPPDRKTHIFNYDRAEVRSSVVVGDLLAGPSTSMACGSTGASMLYRDYSRADGEWCPTSGGADDGAVSLLKQMNAVNHDPSWACRGRRGVDGVAGRDDDGGETGGFGLGHGLDARRARYLARDAVHRRYHHDDLTFRASHPRLALLTTRWSTERACKFAGDAWQQFMTPRMLFGYQAAQPGKSLVFMG